VSDVRLKYYEWWSRIRVPALLICAQWFAKFGLAFVLDRL
jgi:hypothetical protein